MKIVTIIENNNITGVKYGVVETGETATAPQHGHDAYGKMCRIREKRAKKIRMTNTKQK